MPIRKIGTVAREKGKYFVVIGETRHELPVEKTTEQVFEPLVGKKVRVQLSDPVRLIDVIFTPTDRPSKLIPWPCYIPPPDTFRNIAIDEVIINYREMMTAANELLAKNLISPEIHAKLTKNIVMVK
jgi:hypothetical protein